MFARYLGSMFLLFAICLAAGCSSLPEVKLTQTEFVGRVFGYDGQPMPKARVFLTRVPVHEILDQADVAEDGSFRVSTEKNGVLLLRFSGLYHEPETVSVFVNAPERIELEVRLSVTKLKANFDELILWTSPPFEHRRAG